MIADATMRVAAPARSFAPDRFPPPAREPGAARRSRPADQLPRTAMASDPAADRFPVADRRTRARRRRGAAAAASGRRDRRRDRRVAGGRAERHGAPAAKSRPSPTTATRASASPSTSASGAVTPAPPIFPTTRFAPPSTRRWRSPATPRRIRRRASPTPPAWRKRIPDLDLYHPWDLSVDDAIALGREAEAAALAVDRRLTNTEGSTVACNEARIRLRQLARLRRRLPELAPPHRLLGDRRGRRRDAARLLVHGGARAVRPRARGDRRPDRRRAHGAAAQRAADRDDRVPGAVRGPRGRRPDRLLRRRRVGRLALPQVVVPAGLARAGGVRAAPVDPRGAAPPARPRQHAVRQRRRGHRRRATSCATAWSQGYFLGSYSARKLGHRDDRQRGRQPQPRRLATAPTTCRRCCGGWDAGSSSPSSSVRASIRSPATSRAARPASGSKAARSPIRSRRSPSPATSSDMYRDIVAVGSDVDRRGSRHIGSILVGRMTVAGK